MSRRKQARIKFLQNLTSRDESTTRTCGIPQKIRYHDLDPDLWHAGLRDTTLWVCPRDYRNPVFGPWDWKYLCQRFYKWLTSTPQMTQANANVAKNSKVFDSASKFCPPRLPLWTTILGKKTSDRLLLEKIMILFQ